ncbi:MAG: 16S rRNA (guanine(527)-N(7))-methyltransferase RsmG [Dehalococcoidia bacterium]|nr:16S rRNA (guanine(527)-N(7))-methyltransferase RsmG [Dehalococcoidia bacterium]
MKKLIEGACQLGIELSTRQVKQFELYYQKLVEWNKQVNLTAIIDYQEAQVKHFLDSISVISVLTREEINKADFSIIDVGTGAGFPGLPLKILLGEPRIVLVDSTAKKVAFLQYITQELELGGVEIVRGRAEEIAHLPLYRQQFDLVVSRAVAKLSALVELALPFCRLGGKFVAQKKGDVGQEMRKATGAIETMGGKLNQAKRIELKGLDDERYLVVVDKIYFTPGKYPRRSGIPMRRPIQEVSKDVA